MEKTTTCFEALIDFVNKSEEMNDASLFLLKNAHKTTKALWRVINALEDLSDEVLPELTKQGLLSREAKIDFESVKWRIIEQLEPIAHEALKAERRNLPELAKECDRRLMDD